MSSYDVREISLSEAQDVADEAELKDLMNLKNTDRKKMIDAFQKRLTSKEIKFFKEIIEENPNGRWSTKITSKTPMPFHFRQGMGIRNFFRTKGFGEESLGIDNLDNIYVSIVEEAVNSLPDGYSPNKSIFSKIKSFFC